MRTAVAAPSRGYRALRARGLAVRSVPMAPLSPVMSSGQITRWHVREKDHVRVGDLLYDVRVDRLTVDGLPVDMEVEAHEDVYILATLVREGESVAPSTAVALAVDEEDELGDRLLSSDEIRALEQRDQHSFMWQGYVRNVKDGTGMCEKTC